MIKKDIINNFQKLMNEKDKITYYNYELRSLYYKS